MAKQSQANQPPVAPRKPTHRLFCVIGDGDEANWTKSGAM